MSNEFFEIRCACRGCNDGEEYEDLKFFSTLEEGMAYILSLKCEIVDIHITPRYMAIYRNKIVLNG